MTRPSVRSVGIPLALGLAAGAVLLGLHGPGIAAEDLPPGVSLVVASGFPPPDGLGKFQAMTLVIEVTPGSEIPMHSHPGKSQVLLLSGEITVGHPDGKAAVYKVGDEWIEEPGEVHKGTNTSSETARLVWTILLPEGAELTEMHEQ